MEEKKSYLQQRVYDLLGLTEEQCSVPLYIGRYPAIVKKVYWNNEKGEKCSKPELDAEGKQIALPFPLFQSDDKDNIRMFPYTLDGQLIRYERDKQPKYSDFIVEETYFITRMNPEYLAANPGQPKYKFPGGETKKGTYPFFPPTLYESFRKGEHIETVVLTEGYMKAMVASVHGMAVVGLGSITLFADSKSKQLYPDIVRLLNTVKPNNIVILYDGDCTDLGKDAVIDLQAGREPNLSKRPYSFMNSLLKLKDMLLEFKNQKGEPCELFFAYVNKMREDKDIIDEKTGKARTVNDSPKGLDDLLVDPEFSDHTAKIAEDLNNPGRPGIYFKKTNLRTCNDTKIRGVFNCSNPEQFYTAWQHVIGSSRFKYNGGVYFYNAAEKKLVQALDNTLKDYVAIGSEIVLVTEEPIPNAKGSRIEFYPQADKVINARYGDGTSKRLYQYKHYIDYTIQPSHENFSQEIINPAGYRFFNMYSPLNYKPIEGKWPTIEKLLRQITKEYPEEQFHYYEMLLDWITLTYFRPLQFLPILMFVSKERGTGKTSFLNLLKYIYGNNAVIGGNDLIMSKFNSLLAGKLIVGVDESTLGDNKEVGEALKYMSTARTMHIEKKGKDKKEVPAFCKFVLCSNEIKKGVFIAKDEVRFWVMRLTPWAADDEFDQNFEDNIESEVQAFLFYLKTRWERGKMFIKEKEDRMWFDRNRLINEDLYKMMEGTSSNFESSLCDFLHEMFLDTGKLKLHFDVAYIWENVPDAKRKDQNYIHNILKDMKGVTQVAESSKHKMPFRVTKEMMRMDPNMKEVEGEVIWPTRGKQCRPYEFDAMAFLTSAEYEKLKEKKKDTVGDEKNLASKVNAPAPTLFLASNPSSASNPSTSSASPGTSTIISPASEMSPDMRVDDSFDIY